MNLLLDTHVLLWWWTSDGRMGKAAMQAIADADNDIFVSAASVWEIATKHRIGKLPEAEHFLPAIYGHIRRARFKELPITFLHAELAGRMESEHRDPFDRMLIAQAKLEAMPIASGDRAIAAFGLPIIWS